MSGRDPVVPAGSGEPVVGVVDPYLVKDELLKVRARLDEFDFGLGLGGSRLDDWLALRQRQRDLEEQLNQVRSRELDAKIAANAAAEADLLPPGPEEFDLDGMPLTARAAEFRRRRTTPGNPVQAQPADDGGLDASGLMAASGAFLEDLRNTLFDQATDATIRERSIHLEVLLLEQLHRTSSKDRGMTLEQLKAEEQEAKDEAAGYIERLRVLDPEYADRFAGVRWGIFHPAEQEEQRWKERIDEADAESARIAAIISLINTASSYDDGHAFGWRAQTLTPVPTPAVTQPEPGYDAGHGFGWRARIGASPITAPPIKWIALGGVFVVLLAVAIPFLLGAPGASAPSPIPSTIANASAAATGSGAIAATNPAVSCLNLAVEDLTFTGLPGASGQTHVAADCGVVVSAASPHCRVVLGTADARGVRNPSLWDERIGFDQGANHYDVFFQASWYEPEPYVITVPGRGLFAGPAGNPRGGTAEIKMYAGPRGAATTLSWTAESGSITFNTEADAQRPSGGGTVDMQMTGGAGAPIHISGTWHAEQPCRAT